MIEPVPEAPAGTQGPITRVVIDNMRAGRQARRWTATELAHRMTAAGMPWKAGTIAKLETGRRKDITVDELHALAHVFGVLPDAFTTPKLAETIDERLSQLEQAVFGASREQSDSGSKP